MLPELKLKKGSIGEYLRNLETPRYTAICRGTMPQLPLKDIVSNVVDASHQRGEQKVIIRRMTGKELADVERAHERLVSFELPRSSITRCTFSFRHYSSLFKRVIT